MRHLTSTILTAVGVLAMLATVAIGAPDRMNYQGKLTDPAEVPYDGQFDLRFQIYDADDDGTLLWEETHQSVMVSEGIFNVILGSGTPIPSDVWDEDGRWLSIWVTQPPDPFVELTPRQEITSVPWAMGEQYWELQGNTGTTAGPNFLGTTDDEPVEIKANGLRVARFEPPAGDTTGVGPNVLLGYHDNRIQNATGATIGGGGGYGVGTRNWINGGKFGTIGGGEGNAAQGDWATVPGGRMNVAIGKLSFAAGLRAWADDDRCFVWNDGLADSTEGRFYSTAPYQFLIHADGGVGINTNTPQEQLDVDGTVRMTGFEMPTDAAAGLVLVANESGEGTWQTPDLVADQDWEFANDDIYSAVVGNVGIGTAAPETKLEIRSDANDLPALKVVYEGTPADTPAVRGVNTQLEQYGYGGQFEGGWIGVLGRSHPGYYPGETGLSNHYAGVWGAVPGHTRGADLRGVFGEAFGEDGHVGKNYGVYGIATGQAERNCGVYGTALGGNEAWAGYFEGDVLVSDRLDVNAFKMTTGASEGFVLTTSIDGAGTWQPPQATPDLDWTVAGPQMYAGVPGNVGVGTTTPSDKLTVITDSVTPPGPFGGIPAVISAQYTGTQWGAGWPAAVHGTCVPGVGRGVGGHFEGGNTGITGIVDASDATTGSHTGVLAVVTGGSGTINYGVHAEAYGDGTNYAIHGIASGGLSYAGFFEGAVKATGQVTCSVLEITGRGGADLAEPFDVNGSIQSQPGHVLTIDPLEPGKLRVSTKAYDRCVAGVVSGAGGLKPGVMLGKSEAENGQPVALTGRVYCWADASTAPIGPGDLLTTSPTPGHAMKVTDHERAQGSVIGKAMGTLTEGQGLVLILVTLQ